MDDVFDRCGPHGRLFRDLETHYKQQKYCKENFNYVVSKDYNNNYQYYCTLLYIDIIVLTFHREHVYMCKYLQNDIQNINLLQLIQFSHIF